MWLVLLAGVTAACAYILLIAAEFGAAAFDGEMTAQIYLRAFGLPVLAFVLAATAGLGTARTLARRTSRLTVFARVCPWLLGTSAAVLGAVVAAITFYSVLTGAGWFLPS